MKTTFSSKFGVALCLSFLFAAARGTDAADAVQMRYGFAPGTAYAYSFTFELAMSFSSQDAVSGLWTSMGDGSQKAVMHAQLETQTSAADQSLPFTYRVVEQQGTVTYDGHTKPIPSFAETAKKPPVPGTVDPDHRRLALTLTPGSGMENIAERFSVAFPELPGPALAIGSSFENKVTLSVPGFVGKDKTMQITWVYTLKKVDPTEATFDVVQKLPDAAQLSLLTAGTVAVSGGGTGHATWNRAAGVFTSVHIDMDLTVDLDGPLPAGLTIQGAAPSAPGTNGSNGSPAPTKRRAKGTGPLEITLVPAGK